MKKLIIIEDDTDTREMSVFTFENVGYEVVKSDKEIPVQQVIDLKPHIIVIGYKVNGSPGNDICAKLKANEHTVNIPVIIYSAEEDIDKISRNSSADGFIGKPYELDDFVYLVHRIALS